MHKKWAKTPLGTEPSTNGVPRIEKDESKIIANSGRILWMFGMINRYDNEAHVYCVMEDRTQNTLLGLVKRNVYTINEHLEDGETFNSRIYSDSFVSYQYNSFKEAGYLLHRVNHSFWFGSGLFNTNSVEGLWSQLKRLTHDFSGLTINTIILILKNI